MTISVYCRPVRSIWNKRLADRELKLRLVMLPDYGSYCRTEGGASLKRYLQKNETLAENHSWQISAEVLKHCRSDACASEGDHLSAKVQSGR